MCTSLNDGGPLGIKLYRNFKKLSTKRAVIISRLQLIIYVFMFNILQGEVSSSQQLVHSEYLQLLTAFAVGLGLHTVLVSPPHPPHFQAPPPPKEWAWLSNFINAISLAESLTKRSAMPDVNVPKASMPDIEPLPTDAKYQPSVSMPSYCLSLFAKLLDFILRRFIFATYIHVHVIHMQQIFPDV